MDEGILIGVLGPLQVTGGHVPAARQQRLLLAALAAAAPRRSSADALIEGLWRGRAPADARKALQVLVTRLRKSLAATNVGVVLESDGYRLDVDAGRIDLTVFRQLCREADTLPAAQLDQRLDLLERALALHRGEPFADLADEPLLTGASAAVVLHRDAATERLHEARMDSGHAARLVPELTLWAESRPLSEAAWCRLATALHQAGRPTEALRALHTYRRALRDTSGLKPTPALIELEARLLAEDAGVSSSSRQPGNLRLPVASLLGRGDDVRRLAGQLSPHRVVTLVGPGGVGKTALALHVAAATRGRFRDGAWLCELAEIESPDAIVDALATTLGVRQQRGRTLLDSIVASFREADALVVVDNCEHLLPAAADVVGALHRDCAQLRILATSREPLGLSGERVVPVASLDLPADDDPSASTAYRLFVERATDSGATIDASPATAAAIADICRRLDGLPLALELAAARARTMPPLEMRLRLDERFQLLAGRAIDRPRRQRTLWDALDWSYQLLDEPTRLLFNVLAVFLGGFDTDAAVAVSGEGRDEVETRIWSLLDRSMLSISTAGADGTRYHMLETLRYYGHERLVRSASVDAARDAHLAHYLQLAVETGPGVRGPAEPSSVQRITQDIANLRAAHQHAVTQEKGSEAAALVAALHDYAMWRQFFELGTWAEATLALPLGDPALLPTLHAVAGWSRCIAGDFAAAAAHAHAGLTVEHGGGRECGWLHDVLAHCAYFQGDNDSGLAYADIEITRARAAGDPYRLAYVLADSGVHAMLHSRPDLGQQRADEADVLARQTGSASAISMVQLVFGFAHRDTDPTQAVDWFRRSAHLAASVDSSWTIGVSRGELAQLLGRHGDAHEALDLAIDQFRTFRRAGDDARARGVIRMAVPALHRLADTSRRLELIVLDAGTKDRPHVREPHIDKAIAEVVGQVTAEAGQNAVDQAARRGASLEDQAVWDLALTLMEEIHARSQPDDPVAAGR